MARLHFWWMSTGTPDTQLWDLVETLKQTHKHATQANSLDKHTAILSCIGLSNQKKSTAESSVLSARYDEVLVGVPSYSNLPSCGQSIPNGWSLLKPLPCLSVLVGERKMSWNTGSVKCRSSCSASISYVHSIHSVTTFAHLNIISLSFINLLNIL